MYRRSGLVVLYACVATQLAAADYSPDLNKWTTIERPPNPSSGEYQDFMYSANYSQSEWVVSGDGNSVSARLTEDVKTKIDEPKFGLVAGDSVFKGVKAAKMFCHVDDGWLVDYNAGEFGGSLWWYSSDGKTHYKISAHRINEFITTSRGIFAVEGLAHLGLSHGSMIQILRQDGKWTTRTFAALPQSAEAIAVLPDGAFVVVTSDMLLRITPDRDISILVSNGDWGGLYPNSVAVTSSGRIYIGMRQFVVAHDLTDKDQKLQFLVPDKSFLHVEK